MQLYFFVVGIYMYFPFFVFQNDLSLQKYVVLIFDQITRLVFSEIMNFWRKKNQWIKHGVNVEGFPNASFLTVLSPVMLKLICYFKLCCKHIPFSKGFYFVIKKNKYELQYCSVIKWGCDIVKQSLYALKIAQTLGQLKQLFCGDPFIK